MDPKDLRAGSAIDPITLVVIQNGLQQVCNEMDLAFVRAAFSPVIAEALDRSDGIYHRDTGELIAQGELGLPVFVGTMQFSTQAVIERVKEQGTPLEEGDVFVVNDPYLGGTHLMDVKFVKPFFHDGRLFAWLANTGHWPDTGGAVPGGSGVFRSFLQSPAVSGTLGAFLGLGSAATQGVYVSLFDVAHPPNPIKFADLSTPIQSQRGACSPMAVWIALMFRTMSQARPSPAKAPRTPITAP